MSIQKHTLNRILKKNPNFVTLDKKMKVISLVFRVNCGQKRRNVEIFDELMYPNLIVLRKLVSARSMDKKFIKSEY